MRIPTVQSPASGSLATSTFGRDGCPPGSKLPTGRGPRSHRAELLSSIRQWWLMVEWWLGARPWAKHFQMCYLRSKDEEMEAPCWCEFSISVLGLTGLWSRVCAPHGCGSCLPGDVHQCLADAGVSWSETPLWALSSWRFRQEAGVFVSFLLSLRGFVQIPIGCPTGFSRSLCSLRYRKEAKDGRPNTLTINQTLFTISSLLPYINPIGRHAIRAHVYTFLLKRYQWYSFIHP